MMEDDLLAAFASSLFAYLLGSLPFAYLVARATGVNIFEIGTGNPGASNVFRKVGRVHGALVFILDALKGVAAVPVAMALGCPDELLPVACPFAIIGHWWPIFLRFRGGAGLATGLGVIIPTLGLWGLIPAVLALVALPIFRDGPRAAAIAFIAAVAISLGTGPNWISIGATISVVVLLLLRLFLVEFPRDRRGERPEPHLRD